MKRIAIAGNPNAGKTSLFNCLTGSAQQVSNYPGVTVERIEGALTIAGEKISVVDLPGTYSLTAYSQEEVVARQVIIEEQPDLVIDVVDASNLERNLYLTIQLMEMHVPLIIALNMVDVAKNRGVHINAEKLSELLGVPVIPTICNKGKGAQELLSTAMEALSQPTPPLPKLVTYGHEVNDEINRLAETIANTPAMPLTHFPRWAAVKLVEQDEDFVQRLKEQAPQAAAALEKPVADTIESIERHFKDDAATMIAERRYGFAAGAVRECREFSETNRRDITDRIDTLVCNRVLGPIILLSVVAALFLWVFKISDEWAWIPWFGGWVSPTGWMEWFFEQLAEAVAPLETHMPMLYSLIHDGLIGGVGGVMGFVPLIFTMFLFISALEDTGYIARVAFILDRVLQCFGLQGKSILAMIVSGGLGTGGCAVPGVLATRTLREEKDRLITMLVAPFMNCGAKMPVYAMLIAAFFPHQRTQMMLTLWAISWAVALCAAWVLRHWVIRGEQTPFVMELPPYHVPVLRSVLLHTWERTWMYIKKAGTIILLINILLWALMYFPRLPEPADLDTTPEAANEFAVQRLAHSVAGRVGKTMEPVSQYAGFDWRTNIALIGGFAAKEVVLGTLGTAYSMGEVDPEEAEPLSERLHNDPKWNPLRALVLMIFVMIYAPCFVTVAVIRRESGSWKWALFSTCFSTTLAAILAITIYQVGFIMGWGV